MKNFTLLVGATSLLIAGCAAYFSVRGIGLLFSGFMIPVMVMAGSLELGKLVTASFLYRRWKHIPIFMKTYLTTAVFTLIVITSLGIYGYLSDAFTKTSTRVSLYESNIEQLESKNKYLQEQIEGATTAASTVDNKANDAIENFQNIYDSFVERQDKRKQAVMDRLTALDEERNKLEASSGGLFSNKKKKLAELAEAQADERMDIKESLTTIDEESKQEYDAFLAKVDDLRNKTGEVDIQKDVNKYYADIRGNEEEILRLKELIGDTDIGSFKFIAKTFNMELEIVVKWFMIIIVIVFDPLAVCLVIGYNSLLTPKRKTDFVDSKESSDSRVMTSPNIKSPKVYEEYIGTTKEEVAQAVKEAPDPSNAISPEEQRRLNKLKHLDRDFTSTDNLNT
tara:strand:+ start:832 stop:2016 length:1185 start_codon:yes stop_codon:yes gene_type:complete